MYTLFFLNDDFFHLLIQFGVCNVSLDNTKQFPGTKIYKNKELLTYDPYINGLHTVFSQ